MPARSADDVRIETYGGPRDDLRALVEVASWVHEGTDGAHAGHPWLINGPVFARRVARLTGAPVRAR